jgi:DNA-binding transcriptional LysR family regulator
MEVKTMELRHFQYFVAVAEELHFGRAAARLKMTQPPLSQQIKHLEAEVGVPLLMRTQRRVRLTPAGEAFLEEARRVLKAADHAVAAARRAAKGEVGRLTVGFVGSATYDVLPVILREYRRRCPDVQVSLQEMPTPAQVEALRAGEIDIGMVRPPLSEPWLLVEVLQESECVLAIPRTHPLAEQESISLDDVREVPFVLLSRSTWANLYDEILGLCWENGFSPRISQEAKEFQTVIGLVAGGMGIAVVPKSARNLHTRDVIYREVAGRMPTVAMALAWRRESASSIVQTFVRIAKAALVDAHPTV